MRRILYIRAFFAAEKETNLYILYWRKSHIFFLFFLFFFHVCVCSWKTCSYQSNDIENVLLLLLLFLQTKHKLFDINCWVFYFYYCWSWKWLTFFLFVFFWIYYGYFLSAQTVFYVIVYTLRELYKLCFIGYWIHILVDILRQKIYNFFCFESEMVSVIKFSFEELFLFSIGLMVFNAKIDNQSVNEIRIKTNPLKNVTILSICVPHVKPF